MCLCLADEVSSGSAAVGNSGDDFRSPVSFDTSPINQHQIHDEHSPGSARRDHINPYNFQSIAEAEDGVAASVEGINQSLNSGVSCFTPIGLNHLATGNMHILA